MPGHASASALVQPEPGQIAVKAPGRGALTVADVRPPTHWTDEEVAKAVESQQKRAGALVALVRDRSEATWAEIRRELNEAAGGQASSRVMVLAHHAMRAHQALELQTLLAEQAAGEERKNADNGLRNQSGLSVIASQALNQAFEAARAEAGKKVSATDELMARLGHGQTRREVPALSPLQAPGGVAIGSPHAPQPQSPPIPPSGDSE